MEAPPLSTTPKIPILTTSTPPVYPDSVNSSCRSRQTDCGDADPLPHPLPKLRMMCSYGGHIVQRPSDKALCYVGGDTRIIVVDRHTTLSHLRHRLSWSLLRNQPFSLKYQLPSEQLDSLISVTTDEDLENMVEEYDRLNIGGGSKSGRLRLFLFPKASSSVEQILVETASVKSEEWFFNASNGKPSSTAVSDRGFPESSSVNCLLRLDDDFVRKTVAVEVDREAGIEASRAGYTVNHVINQGVQSVPDSPMLGTSSSFGSTSSCPSVANFPPNRVFPDENPKVGGTGIEEQFQKMSVRVVNLPPSLKQEETRIYTAAGVHSATMVAGTPVVVGGEYANRIIPDVESSDLGGIRKVQPIEPQVQAPLQSQQIPQFQQPQTGALDLPTPDSVFSEGSITNALPSQRQSLYTEPFIQIQSTNTRVSSNEVENKTLGQNNTLAQTQSLVQELGYMLSNPYEQNRPPLHQPQASIHAGNQYASSNAVPISSYYPIYTPHPQNHYQYPVYFVPNQTPNNHSSSVPPSKPEISSGAYRTPSPQFVQVTSGQEQFVGLNPIYQPSSAHNFVGYEFVDENNRPLYYKHPLPQMAAQCQTLVSAPGTATGVPGSSREAQP